MINVVYSRNQIVFGDANALYVWADVSKPAWGTYATSQQGSMSQKTFPLSDWLDAIVAAYEDAEKRGLATVYVII